MNARRLIILVVVILLLFLGIYTWNQRTGRFDAFSANVGLEVSGGVLRVFQGTKGAIVGWWENYADLRSVRKENAVLSMQVQELNRELAVAQEERQELLRLRKLLSIAAQQPWDAEGASILAQRIGSNAGLETLMLSKGYRNGARPGNPVVVSEGLVGRVLKAGPGTSQALLLTDPGFSVAVVDREERARGIVHGEGVGKPVSVSFIRNNTPVNVGDILVTSGLDQAYPKGIPVARVIAVSSSTGAMLEVQAVPLVTFTSMEEVLVLQRPVGFFAPQASPVYNPRPKIDFTDGSAVPVPENAVSVPDSAPSLPAAARDVRP